MKKTTISIIFFLTILFILLFSFHCQSYSKEIKKFSEEKRKVYLYNFSNQTFEPIIHIELTNAVRERLHIHNSLILNKQPDTSIYFISGNVTMFRRETLLYDNEFQTLHYNVEAIVEVSLLKGNNEIYKDEFYDSIRYSTKEVIVENDALARRRLYDKLSRKIVLQIEKVIWDDLKANDYGIPHQN